jgi:hypothetical protein
LRFLKRRGRLNAISGPGPPHGPDRRLGADRGKWRCALHGGHRFGDFGVNIGGLDSEQGAVPANATVVLSNFSAPAPVPEPGA